MIQLGKGMIKLSLVLFYLFLLGILGIPCVLIILGALTS